MKLPEYLGFREVPEGQASTRNTVLFATYLGLAGLAMLGFEVLVDYRAITGLGQAKVNFGSILKGMLIGAVGALCVLWSGWMFLRIGIEVFLGRKRSGE